MNPIIIIGAGMAGYSVARELRKLDKTTPLTIISADDGGFYSKPMLSNAFAQNKSAAQLASQTAAQMAAQLDATVLPRTRVTGIDTGERIVRTDAGPVAYTKLVLAVGAQPIRITLEGDAADQVLSVNDLRDYAVFRERIAQAQKRGPVQVAILGAGLIGCEFANDLAAAGFAVTLIDPNPRPLAALAAPALSTGLQQALHAAGVAFRLGTSATRVERAHDDACNVALADGTSLQADLVLSAVGLRPDLRLAQAAQLATARGILVDGAGRTSAPDVYALGDCAEYAMPDAGMPSQVMPYIAPILAAARAIARSLTGQVTAIDWKPAPVIVKTPCYPLALVPPPLAAIDGGMWHAQTDGGKTICRFIDDQGVLRGFGVAPQEAASRQALLAALGTAVPPVDLAA